jgi:hypothetical protein
MVGYRTEIKLSTRDGRSETRQKAQGSEAQQSDGKNFIWGEEEFVSRRIFYFVN